MKSKFVFIQLYNLALVLLVSGCVPAIERLEPQVDIPESFPGVVAQESEQEQAPHLINWREFFKEPELVALCDEALANNQELKVLLQEIEITKNEALARQGRYLPELGLGAHAGVDKVGEYTREGVVEENHEIEHGTSFPDPLPEFALGLHASWEVDIWKKLRNAEKSAILRYMASVEGRRFAVTNLVAEIANSYYELIALDNQLDIVKKNIGIQSNALETARLQKQGARITELPLRRFEAQLAQTKSLQFEISQKITETENRINFLLGRYPQKVVRSKKPLMYLMPASISVGLPAKLLNNRPDIRQAEYELKAADLNIDVARAGFYPSLKISGNVGYSAYDTARLFESPESLIYSLAGGLTAPLINRRELTAEYLSANAKQAQAVTAYQRAILAAFIEVANQVSNIKNLEQRSALKARQAQALEESVKISTTLFNAARADYLEVLLTQREAIDARFELIEARASQLHASVDIYRSLGGGWDHENGEGQTKL